MTISYVTIMVCQFVSIIQRRSVHGFFSRYQLSNGVFWLALAVGAAVMLVIVYVPFVAGFFGTGPLGAVDWLFVLGAAAAFLVIREAGRVVRRSPVVR